MILWTKGIVYFCKAIVGFSESKIYPYLVTIMHLWRARTVRVTIDWIPRLQNNPSFL